MRGCGIMHLILAVLLCVCLRSASAFRLQSGRGVGGQQTVPGGLVSVRADLGRSSRPHLDGHLGDAGAFCVGQLRCSTLLCQQYCCAATGTVGSPSESQALHLRCVSAALYNMSRLSR